ncbi:E3 ubiquitin-protein ligase FANCL [Phlebotomus argentipes]|uniref:E3 ubiquitin-protein ligase FANCL n=1 Tax=Phlebotomus argentipes TaxID=94469 RepID=UPI002892D664|nr:E3 ubiquitin-protein ligase FANCL [Phlebotomus argentipes]
MNNFLENFLEIDENIHKFVGFFTTKGNSFKIHLTAPEYPEAGNATIEVFNSCRKIPLDLPPDPKESIQKYVRRLEAHLEANECEEVCELDEILDSVKRFDKLLENLESLEKSGHNVKVTADYSKIKINGISENEHHYLEFAVTDKAQVKVTEHSLPPQLEKMFWKIGSIESHLANFNALLEQLNEFYDNMHTIDELCFIVGPANITTKTTSRIIKFNEKIFLKISIDPLIPSQVALVFIGPIAEVEPLREIYNEKIADWDVEMDVHKNLLRMYDLIYFPMREDDVETPCNICFDYLQGNTIPIIRCDNDKCDVIFHLQCLKHYFATLPSSKTMFTVAMGQCPFCRVKLTTFLELEADEEGY